jgi:transcriptional regulator with XRE-family HTH domain
MEALPTGQAIKSARIRAGLTQQTLAERAGLALRTLTRIENGEDIKLSTLLAIADALNLSITDLVGDDVPAA